MNLRNKKTGELKEFDFVGAAQLGEVNEIYSSKGYASLAELNEEWEDYEESEDFWFIDPVAGIVSESKDPDLWLESCDLALMKSIGNYFETEEEAKKAVEKLKALKRLRDKGFRFEGIKQDYTKFSDQMPFRNGRLYLQFNKAEDDEWLKENYNDLDLIFGGDND